MYPEIDVLGLHIQTYGVMVLLGFIAAYFTVKIRAKHAGIKTDIFYLSVWALVGGFLVAKITYWITVFGRMCTAIGNIGDTLTFAEFAKDYILSGFVFYGGLIGGVLAVAWYLHDERQKFSDFVNVVMPAIPLAQAIGRIGCYCAGCCYGTVCEISDVKIPVQLVSSACNFIIAGVLLLVLNKNRKRPIGLALYLLMYSVVRFILEFFREDTIRGHVGVLSTSQFIGIFLFLLGIALLIFEKPIYGWVDALILKPTKQMKKEAKEAAAKAAETAGDAPAGEETAQAPAEETSDDKSGEEKKEESEKPEEKSGDDGK